MSILPINLKIWLCYASIILASNYLEGMDMLLIYTELLSKLLTSKF